MYKTEMVKKMELTYFSQVALRSTYNKVIHLYMDTAEKARNKKAARATTNFRELPSDL